MLNAIQRLGCLEELIVKLSKIGCLLEIGIVRKIQFYHEKEIDKLKDSTEAGGGSFSFVNVLLLKLLIKDNGGFLPATSTALGRCLSATTKPRLTCLKLSINRKDLTKILP
ncbi:hypothetical protein Tco_0885772, partial [Tanacetum coccineum]